MPPKSKISAIQTQPNRARRTRDTRVNTQYPYFIKVQYLLYFDLLKLALNDAVIKPAF